MVDTETEEHLCCPCCLRFSDCKQKYEEDLKEWNSWTVRSCCVRKEFFDTVMIVFFMTLTSCLLFGEYGLRQRLQLSSSKPYFIDSKMCTCGDAICPEVKFTFNFASCENLEKNSEQVSL